MWSPERWGRVWPKRARAAIKPPAKDQPKGQAAKVLVTDTARPLVFSTYYGKCQGNEQKKVILQGRIEGEDVLYMKRGQRAEINHREHCECLVTDTALTGSPRTHVKYSTFSLNSIPF